MIEKQKPENLLKFCKEWFAGKNYNYLVAGAVSTSGYLMAINKKDSSS